MKIGIVGYGNLGRGVEIAAQKYEDIEVVGVFTRRDPDKVNTIYTKTYKVDDILNFKDEIDVLILCGGSATDLPKQGPEFAKNFNVIDSFDTHAKIPEYFDAVNKAALENNKTCIISVGWDPGLFSMQRVLFDSVLPEGENYTFWGKGVSQGHSDAIRRIDGVLDAKQYTIPISEAVEKVRTGENPDLTTREKHLRECFVVAKEGYDKEEIKEKIVNMPNYFADYNTVVHFITKEELINNHSAMPHGGFVIRGGKTGVNNETKQVLEFSLNLGSNPEFTSSVLVAFARAAKRLSDEKSFGAKTVLDIPLSYLSTKSNEELLKTMV